MGRIQLQRRHGSLSMSEGGMGWNCLRVGIEGVWWNSDAQGGHRDELELKGVIPP